MIFNDLTESGEGIVRYELEIVSYNALTAHT